VQAHTLGEAGNLDTVSLRVCSGTILPIFIEIGSYLTEKEQKISWHRFFWDTVKIANFECKYPYIRYTATESVGESLNDRHTPTRYH